MTNKSGIKDPRKNWSAEHRANFLATQKRMLAAGEWGNRKPGGKKKPAKPSKHGGHRPAAQTPEAKAKRIASNARTRKQQDAAQQNGHEVGMSFPLDIIPALPKTKRQYIKRPAVRIDQIPVIVSDGDKLILANKIADIFARLLA